MVPFAGWAMPVQYTGIVDEHLHTRRRAGLFDISHMGAFFVRGSRALEDLDRLVTCRIDTLRRGQARYGFLMREDGTVVDDLIVYRTAPDQIMLIVNAATRAKDADWIQAHLSPASSFDDQSDALAKLALQGPASERVMANFIGSEHARTIRPFGFEEVQIEETRVILSRTGYTGEVGYELFYPAERAEKVWDLLAGVDGVKPVGLGARDTLRLEAGYPLYGHDISDTRTPIEANLDRFVCFEKDFIGKQALEREHDQGTREVLMGFVCEGRRSAREGFEVHVAGRRAGEVTSGAFSPCLKRGIGLCYLDRRDARSGQAITLKKEKSEIAATVQSVPVYQRREG